MIPEMLQLFLAVGVFSAVICRARHFDDTTFWYVKAQHAGLAIGALLSVFVPVEWAASCALAGVVLFLLLTMARWSEDAPHGITKPEDRPRVILYPWRGRER